MSMLIDYLSAAMLLAGCFLIFTGALGVQRFPDTLSRMHASGITDTMGSTLILGGLMLLAGFGLELMKLIMVLVFILMTNPTSGYALAKATWQSTNKAEKS